MAFRSSELHVTRSGYLRDLPEDDAATSPAIPGAAATALYLQEAGDPSVISVTDINQGQLGDCFLLASIGEIALWHPEAIMNMIAANTDGTETVTLYLAANGQLPTYGTTSFKPTSITLSNTFPGNAVNNGASQDVVNGVKEIWVQVLEKAVATLGGGYTSIANGGSPMIAMEELAGQQTSWMSPGSLTLQTLQADAAAGDLIVMDTPSVGVLPYNLVNDHAYMFESVNLVNGTPMIQLGNPWGFNQPQAIPLSQLASGIIEVDIGQFVDNNLITGGTGDDTKTLIAPVTNASVDLGAGKDTLILADGTNSATVANTETVVGGTGDDTIVLATVSSNASIDLGAGNDHLTLGNFTNVATVANVETMTGGTGNDTVTLRTPLTSSDSVDLGAGRNKLTLADGGNTDTLNHAATLIGGTGNDTITLGGALVNGSVDLGGGSDTLALTNLTNRISVANTETVFGGSGNDTIILTGSAAQSVIGGAGMNFITGNTAADRFVFDQNAYGDITWLTNFSTAKGDTIALDTTGQSSFLANTYDLGGAALVLGTSLADVADWAARIATTLNNGGKGGFLYEQDTGELFYSANGSFAGGGTEIGIVTSNGSTPWTFDPNSFVQV